LYTTLFIDRPSSTSATSRALFNREERVSSEEDEEDRHHHQLVH